MLILSDRGVDESRVAIPSLLAVSAVHQHLVKTKKCTALSLILESGEPREVHHFATLLGYGACAVNPYLAHACIAELTEDGLLEKDYYAAVQDYDTAVLQGVVKIASKMGISTLQSYQGSQLFEALGISGEVIDEYFTGTISRIGGITLADIARRTDEAHARAFDPLGLPADTTLPSLVGGTSCAAGAKSTATTPRPSTCCRKPCAAATTACSASLRTVSTKAAPAFCAGCSPSAAPNTACRWRRWRASSRSCSISRPGHVLRLHLAGSARGAGRRHEPLHGKSNSGEGGESDERLASAARPTTAAAHQAGGQRAVRRDQPLPCQRQE